MKENIYMFQFKRHIFSKKMISYEIQVSTVNFKRVTSYDYYYGFTKEKFDLFLDELKQCNFNLWEKNYEGSNTDSGEEWFLKIYTSTNEYEYKGINNYPKEWDLFLNILNKYINSIDD